MKNLVKKMLGALCYGVRNILDPLFHFQEIAILAYHSISDSMLDTAVSAADLENQLRYLQQKGFRFVSLEETIAWAKQSSGGSQKRTMPKKAIAVTFDDGYADFETTALPILERFSVPVTLFLIGEMDDLALVHANLQNTIPLLTLEARDRLLAHPLVSFGYHSRTHANVRKIQGESLQKEIAPIFPAQFFAYPGGNYSNEALAEVEREGYAAAFSIKRHLVKKFIKPSDRYLVPRTVVTRTMKPWEVGMHVTQAIEWYRALTSWVK